MKVRCRRFVFCLGFIMVACGPAVDEREPATDPSPSTPGDGPAVAGQGTELGKWSNLPKKYGPRGRAGHSLIWAGDRLLVFGGVDEFGQVSSSGAEWRPGRSEWKPLGQLDKPEARYGHSATWSGRRVYVWGGKTVRPEGAELLNDGAVYDLVSQKWQALPADGAPSARCEHQAFWYRGRLVVWGGMGDGAFVQTGSRFTAASGQWSETRRISIEDTVMYQRAAQDGKYMYVVLTTAESGYILRYHMGRNKWQVLASPEALAGLSGFALLIQQGRLWIHGGERISNVKQEGFSSDLFHLDLETRRWAKAKGKSVIKGRVGHQLLGDGEYLFVFGGHDGKAVLKQSGIYLTDSKRWIAVPADYGGRTGYEGLFADGTFYFFGGRKEDEQPERGLRFELDYARLKKVVGQ